MVEKSRPIVIADKPVKEYVYVILCELQHEDHVVLHATDHNMRTVERIIKLFSRFMEENEDRKRVPTINERTKEEMIVNQVSLELFDMLKE